MKRIILTFVTAFILTLTVNAQYYQLRYDSVGILSKFKLMKVTTGASSDSLLTKKANGGVYKIAQSTFANISGGNNFSGNQIITGNLYINNIQPNADVTYNIGSPSLQYSTGYFTRIASKSGTSFSVGTEGSNTFNIFTNNTNRWRVDGTGNLYPFVSETYTLGSSTNLMANFYTSAIQLSLTGLLKGNGAGSNVSVAVPGTDYEAAMTNTVSSVGTLSLTTAGYYTMNGTTSTWTLPTISGNTKVKYVLMNQASGNITINSNAGGNDIYSGGTAVNTISLAPGQTAILYNNSVKWFRQL